MNHETMLAFLMGQRRGGGSSGGGEVTYGWVPFCADATTWTGEEIHLVEGGETYSYTGDVAVSPHDQYKVTFQNGEFICSTEYMGGKGVSNIRCPVDINKLSNGSYKITPNPGIVGWSYDITTPFKVEAWMGEEPYDMTFETLRNIVEIPVASVYKPADILKIPEGVTDIGEAAFSANIRSNNAWFKSLKLPGSVKIIHSDAFSGQTYLKTVKFSEGLEEIYANAFYGCERLTSITLPSTIKSISSSAFPSSLTEINVPWAEGEVVGAPWGATDATINYGYTG